MNTWFKKCHEPTPFSRSRWSLKSNFDTDSIKSKKNQHVEKPTTWLHRYSLLSENHSILRPIHVPIGENPHTTVALKAKCRPNQVKVYRYIKEKKPYNTHNYGFVPVRIK